MIGRSEEVDPETRLVCAGCGYVAPTADPHPFRCPHSGRDATDHVLAPVLGPGLAAAAREAVLDTEPNPFLRFRRLFHGYHTARARGLSDPDYVAIVRGLDAAVAQVDGAGFRETPFTVGGSLGRRLSLGAGGALWIKDETGNVSGSHKARHLMGVAIWLAVVEGQEPGADGLELPRLVIASCGNAALAAAVVARAADRPLSVFIPPDAHPRIVARLRDLGAELVLCPREGKAPGDPCYHRFQEATARGALPFTCQGSENGLIFEGGKTLAWEMVSALLRQRAHLDRIIVQVGGGALASSLIQGFEDARKLGLIEKLPRFHSVQTQGAHPLKRAYDRLVERVLGGGGHRIPGPPRGSDAQRAELLETRVPRPILDQELRHAATHRSEFMWPWEREPQSVATGILDDETYDWLAVVRGMVTTGGFPVVVSEESLREAHRLARAETGIAADPTGTAGLAGLLELSRSGVVRPEESVAVLFSGVER